MHDGNEGVPSSALLEIDLLQELNHLIIVLRAPHLAQAHSHLRALWPGPQEVLILP